MRTYTINVQCYFAPQYAGRSDGRFRLFDENDEETEYEEAEIVSEEHPNLALYSVSLSGVPRSYYPGYGLMDFTENSYIEPFLVTGGVLRELIDREREEERNDAVDD